MTNMYCNECINCVENPIIPQLKRENAEIDIQIDYNFIYTHCKTNIISRKWLYSWMDHFAS